MQRILRSLLLVACFINLLLSGQTTVLAQSSSARVDTALKSLHRWVDTSERGVGWRRYLMSDALEAELQKGERADRLVLRAVLDRYSSGKRGLELSRFVAVRRALEGWLEELPPLEADQLAAAAREARGQFAPKTEADVLRARQGLDQAVSALDRLMARWVVETRSDWQDYLNWPMLKEQLQAETADRDSLRAVLGKFFANQEGLELPQFVAVRESLQSYVDVQTFAANPGAQQFYERHMDELAERLEAHQQQPSAEDAVRIGQIIGWMTRYGQATELTDAVRHHLARPNLFVQLSESMIRTGIETDIEENLRVRENILGTAIRGNATMKGRVSIDLIPSQNSAAIDLLLTGTTYSNNTGYNGPVTIFSTGVTSVDARKRVLVDAEGITVQRARAACRTNSRIHRISAKSPMIERVAWKRAGRTKPEVERIANQRAARRVAAQMDSEVVEVLAPAKELFAEKFRNPLVRRGGFPQEFLLRTTDDYLFIQATQASVDQLGAPDEPPDLSADHDVAARIHQSLVGNLSQAYLGGVTWTDERIALFAERLTGDVPPALEMTRDDPPWSITFAHERPLDARFDENRITMILRARRFTRGDQELRENVEVSAVYDVEKTATGSRLTRQGDVDVKFGDAKTLSVGNVAIKTFVRNKFESLFQAEFESDGVALPGRWQMAGKMRLDQLLCANGWLVFGWHQPTLEARAASPPAREIEIESLRVTY
jgi:hypothetical protein